MDFSIYFYPVPSPIQPHCRDIEKDTQKSFISKLIPMMFFPAQRWLPYLQLVLERFNAPKEM